MIDEVLPWPDVNRLIQLSDCYMSLHRAEGLGLTLAEAMMLRTPVIGTNYSGNLDFMNDQNSYLVRWTPCSVGERYQAYDVRGATWADPDVVHASEQLQRVFEQREEARQRARLAERDVRAQFSMSAYAERLNAGLARLRA